MIVLDEDNLVGTLLAIVDFLLYLLVVHPQEVYNLHALIVVGQLLLKVVNQKVDVCRKFTGYYQSALLDYLLFQTFKCHLGLEQNFYSA